MPTCACRLPVLKLVGISRGKGKVLGGEARDAVAYRVLPEVLFSLTKWWREWQKVLPLQA
ncbi:MAG: hypothetical protein IJZ86_05230 [Bacteroides sp.]|nr:hypothetical protein [Bacteroides sp.]